MRVLIYDDYSKDLENLYNIVNLLPFQISEKVTNSLEEAIELVDNNSFDKVFINIDQEKGKELVDYLITLNPTQRIITFSQNYFCYDKNGCDNCMQNYNKYKILKPVLVKDIMKIFKEDIPCEYKYCSNEFYGKLLIISKQFNEYDFCMEDLKFTSKQKKSHHHNNSETVKLATTLKSQNIDFRVDGNNIKILS